ncbi:Adenylate Cyclase Type 2 [Manis pentadactyla]|nr:Adenylate Cyclase Type 2 [Manis pentadactyla]
MKGDGAEKQKEEDGKHSAATYLRVSPRGTRRPTVWYRLATRRALLKESQKYDNMIYNCHCFHGHFGYYGIQGLKPDNRDRLDQRVPRRLLLTKG